MLVSSSHVEAVVVVIEVCVLKNRRTRNEGFDTFFKYIFWGTSGAACCMASALDMRPGFLTEPHATCRLSAPHRLFCHRPILSSCPAKHVTGVYKLVLIGYG